MFWALSGGYHYLDIWSEPGVDAGGRRRGYLEVLPQTPALPWSWLGADELDHYVQAFARTGFTGGLNWYRAGDLVWEQNRQRGFDTAPITVPVGFLAGEKDTVVEMFGARGLEAMRASVPNLEEVRLVPGAGHFVQQEAPEATTGFLLDCLERWT